MEQRLIVAARAAGQRAKDVVRLGERAGVVRLAGQCQRAAGERLGALAVALAARDEAPAGVGLGAVGGWPALAPGGQRIREMTFRQAPVTAPGVDAAELPLQSRDALRLAERGSALIASQGSGIGAEQRVEVANRFMQRGGVRVAQ